MARPADRVFPRPVERRYRAFLINRWRRLHERVPRLDASRAVNGTRITWTIPTLEQLAPFAAAVDSWSTDAVVREVQRLVAIDVREAAGRRNLKELHTAWARANVQLIRDVDTDLLDRMAALVEETVARGKPLDDLVQARLGVAESRARTIARTEVAKLNSQISQARMEDVGIDRYEWSTSGDERVRPAHAALDGTTRAWDDPHPTEGHPGTAVNCRCVALPVVE